MPRPGATAGRDAAVVIGVLLVLGLLCGLLWSQVVTSAEFTKVADGGAMEGDQLGNKFDADGWYVVIAVPAGLLAGLVLTARRSRDALVTSGLLVVGSVLAAAAMALTGYLMGPGDPRAALAVAKVGATVPERLDVDAFAVYLGWPVGVLAGALFVLLGRVPQADAARRHAD